MLGTFLLWFNGVAFLFFGLMCFISPESLTDLTGYQLTNADARAEFSATYGGLFLMIGLFGIFSVNQARLRYGGLLMLFLAYLGLATGRLIGMTVSEGQLTHYSWGAWSYETLCVLLFLMALWQEKLTANSNEVDG